MSEITRLRKVLIEQISRTRALQERLEIIQEALDDNFKGELSDGACLMVIRLFAKE